jgi:hypothetical protein
MNKLKKFILFLEDYAIVTGGLKKYFRPWLSWRYRRDLQRLMTYFQIWQCIQEGLEGYHTWRIFLKSYDWPAEYFQRIVSIAGYLGKVRISSANPYTKQAWLILNKPEPSISVNGLEPITEGEEANHA